MSREKQIEEMAIAGLINYALREIPQTFYTTQSTASRAKMS